jgi:hypothetical protein
VLVENQLAMGVELIPETNVTKDTKAEQNINSILILNLFLVT